MHRHAQPPAGRRRHQPARGAELEPAERADDQWQEHGINLTYDGNTNRESHGGNLAAPGARLDCGSAAFSRRTSRPSTAAVPARRSRSSRAAGRSDFRGSAAFYKRDAALNGNEYARESSAVRARRTSANRRSTGSTTSRGRSAVPSSCPAATSTAAQPAVLLLVAGSAGADGSRRAQSAADAHGARAARRFLADARQPQPAGLHPRSAATRETATPTPRAPGRPASPGNVIPANRIDATAQALLNLFPLPNASDPTGRTVQLHVPDGDGLAAQRPGAARRLERRAAHDRLRPRAVRTTRSAEGPSTPFGFTGGWPQMDGKFETESISYVNTLLHSIGPTTFLDATAGVNRRIQRASPVSQAALDANTRSKVLPGSRSSFPRPTRWTSCRTRRSTALRCRARIGCFSTSAGFPSTATTRCGMSRPA